MGPPSEAQLMPFTKKLTGFWLITKESWWYLYHPLKLGILCATLFGSGTLGTRAWTQESIRVRHWDPSLSIQALCPGISLHHLRFYSTHLSGVLLFPFSLTSSRSSEESTGEVVLVSSSSCSCWARYWAGFCLANLAQWSSSLWRSGRLACEKQDRSLLSESEEHKREKEIKKKSNQRKTSKGPKTKPRNGVGYIFISKSCLFLSSRVIQAAVCSLSRRTSVTSHDLRRINAHCIGSALLSPAEPFLCRLTGSRRYGFKDIWWALFPRKRMKALHQAGISLWKLGFKVC